MKPPLPGILFCLIFFAATAVVQHIEKRVMPYFGRMKRSRPPALWEIAALPVIAAVVVEWIHTPRNELYLLASPFLLIAIRLFIASNQQPPQGPDVPDEVFRRAVRRYLLLNQAAVLPLLFFQLTVVVAGSPTVPPFLWAFAALFLLIYVAIRLRARTFWIVAATEAAAVQPSGIGPEGQKPC